MTSRQQQQQQQQQASNLEDSILSSHDDSATSLSTTPKQSYVTAPGLSSNETATTANSASAASTSNNWAPSPGLVSSPGALRPGPRAGVRNAASSSFSAARDSTISDEGSQAAAAGGAGTLGRGLPLSNARPTSRFRGGSISSSREMSSSSYQAAPNTQQQGVGRMGLSAGNAYSTYAPSDVDAQSLSGLSASELGPDESGDDLGPAAPPRPQYSRGATSSHTVTTQGTSATTRQRRTSAAPGSRSQSRQRRSSALVARSDDDDDDDDARGAYGPLDEEDDEVVPQDRGEELVRRRMRARQREKRKKEKEAEKKRQRAAATEQPPSRPTSPRVRQASTATARAASPSPYSAASGTGGDTLDRDGRPTFIALPVPPRSAADGGGRLSPAMAGPATSPGPVSFRQALSAAGATNTGPQGAAGMYPSPHAHIRRPSAPAGDRRVSSSTAGGGGGVLSLPRNASTQRQSQAPDVFFDGAAGAAATNRAESVAGASSVAGDDAEAEHDDDEGRDTVADLREARQARPQSRREDDGEDEQDEQDQGEGAAPDDDDDDGAGLSPEDSASASASDDGDVEYTLKDRQDAINIEHPFGLPIWKPALYKKSRTVTRNAENDLHSVPSRAAERHLLPGNILWTVCFGSWLGVVCVLASLALRLVPVGGTRYARVAWELGGYLFWPFGKFVEVEISAKTGERSAPARIDGNNKWSFAQKDDGECDGFPSHDGENTYTTAFTPVAARFPHDHEHHRVAFNARSSRPVSHAESHASSSGGGLERYDTIRPGDVAASGGAGTGADSTGSSASEGAKHSNVITPKASRNNASETTPLNVGKGKGRSSASYGAVDDGEDGLGGEDDEDDSEAARVARESKIYEYVVDEHGRDVGLSGRWLGATAYGIVFWLIIAPILSLICLACWGMVVTIPMAKLTWVLIKNLAHRPLALHFGSALEQHDDRSNNAATLDDAAKKLFLPLKPGQAKIGPHATADGLQPLSARRSKILLCTYRAIGLQYYKYTVGGVNILFVNTLPFVGFTIFDFFFLEPYVIKHPHLHGGFLAWISSQSVIFVCALGSVIPLSYFIGMAVASISAQSSIGMGAVINATFGSIIEIILYAIALTQEKARLVEGSIIGSILAGVLLMPGLSMCSGATRRKEQRFNARSAGVTSTMLIMAIIGILTPTLFYQIYGTFQLTCTGCPADGAVGEDWTCKRCFYEHVPPATDPFYQTSVKGLMYTCTVILVLSYAIGLWFSLRTHASQIWQNTQPAAPALPAGTHAQLQQHQQQQHHHAGGGASGEAITTAPTFHQIPSAQRASIYKKLIPASMMQQLLPTTINNKGSAGRGGSSTVGETTHGSVPSSSSLEPPPLRLPESFSQEDYAKAMAFTASAFQTAIQQHQREQAAAAAAAAGNAGGSSSRPGSRVSVGGHGHQRSSTTATAVPSEQHTHPGRGVSMTETEHGGGAHHHQGAGAGQGAIAHNQVTAHHGGDDGGHGGHDAPSWSRAVSLTVLLSCTVLYAIIAEILVDVVDVVLDGSGIDEKFLGVTLFALVPNTTEFMNAMSFAINGNIALSMEIGSAYALQVCLIQIPAMVAWSAYSNYSRGIAGAPLIHRSFTLIFPRWDVIAIIFSVFLLTYTYIEARSNYYRGSICILSYLVLVAGFYFAPPTGDVEAPGDGAPEDFVGAAVAGGAMLTSMAWQSAKEAGIGWGQWVGAVWGALYTR